LPADKKVGSAQPQARRVDAAAHTAKPGGAVDTTELFERWQRDRDPRAREQLVARFLPLARKLALRYGGGHEPLEDRVQVASIGLLKAIDRFDVARGTAFTSFAVPTMLGELKRYFRSVGWSAHVPRGSQEAALTLRQGEQALAARLGRSPTVQELAEHLEFSLEQTLDALQAAAAQYPVALDAPLAEASDDERLTIVDTLGEEDARFEHLLATLSVTTAAGQLTFRQRHVLELRFGQELTQAQIAKRIGVSQMHVSRILRSTLTELNEIVEHGQIRDQTIDNEMADVAFPGAPGYTEPPGGRSSRPTIRGRAQGQRPQPALR
jgi:RNA polymerase sigma-B factor